MRVVYVDHCAALSGGEIALLRLLAALDVDKRVVLGEDGPLVARLREVGATVEVLPFGPTGDLRRDRVGARLPARAVVDTVGYARRLARLLRGADVVHTNSLKAHLYGGIAGRLARVPVLWHVRDRVAPDYLPRPAVAMVRAAARVLPAQVVANSRATLATLGRPGLVVPDPLPALVVARRPAPGFTVGMVGRIAPWKGQHVAIEALARVPEARLVVVGAPLFGEDDYAASLRSLAERLGVADRVEFAGFREDVAAELGRFDALVHASVVPEPFGQVVVEGMAAGLPVVAADAGGPAEVVERGVTGLLVPPGDAAALADALTTLAADPALRDRLGAAGRAAAAAYDPARIAATMLSTYAALTARRRRSRP